MSQVLVASGSEALYPLLARSGIALPIEIQNNKARIVILQYSLIVFLKFETQNSTRVIWD